MKKTSIVRVAGEAVDLDSLVTEWETASRKPAKVDAKQLTVPFQVDRPDSIVAGHPGDWIVRKDNGELSVVAQSEFSGLYVIGGEHIPRYTQSDIRSARQELLQNTLDNVPRGVSRNDARAGAKALCRVLEPSY